MAERDEARHALVMWPDDPSPLHDPDAYPCCIYRTVGGQDCVEAALARGAIVVAVERDDWCHPRERPAPQQASLAPRRVYRARPRKKRSWWLNDLKGEPYSDGGDA